MSGDFMPDAPTLTEEVTGEKTGLLKHIDIDAGKAAFEVMKGLPEADGIDMSKIDIVPLRPRGVTDGSEISHEMAFKLFDSARTTRSALDPDGNAMYRTLAQMKKPALPLVEHNWEALSQIAYFRMRDLTQKGGDALKMRLPVRASESMFTLKNRVRMVPGDNKSPMGILIKSDLLLESTHKPYACIAVLAHELFKYAVNQLGDRPSWLPKDEPLE